MSYTVEKAAIKVLKGYPEDKVWNVVISFPETLEDYKNNSKVIGPLDYALYRFQGWTDEPVDTNDLQLMAYNENNKEYKLIKGDDATIPERVQYEMLTAAREAMFEAREALS